MLRAGENDSKSVHPFYALGVCLLSSHTTQPYWDALYAQEIATLEGGSTEGLTQWFGPTPVLAFLSLLSSPDLLPSLSPARETRSLRVLEVGTGNGHLLLLLARMGARMGVGTLHGIDRSSAAIEAAQAFRSVMEREGKQAESVEEGEEEEGVEVTFSVDDVVESELGREAWEVVLDKGALDCLVMEEKIVDSDDDEAEFASATVHSVQMAQPGFSPVASALRNVARLLVQDGYFVLFTTTLGLDEMLRYLDSSAAPLTLVHDLSHLVQTVQTDGDQTANPDHATSSHPPPPAAACHDANDANDANERW